MAAPIPRRQGAPSLRSVKVLTFAMSPYQVQAADDYFLVDATGGAVVLTLPPILALQKAYLQREIVAKKIDASGNAVTITATVPDLIDGAATLAIGTQYGARRITNDLNADLAGWWVIGKV